MGEYKYVVIICPTASHVSSKTDFELHPCREHQCFACLTQRGSKNTHVYQKAIVYTFQDLPTMKCQLGEVSGARKEQLDTVI